MSKGKYRRREGLSKYNKIYEFDDTILGQRSKMIMTSVSGHLLNYAFSGLYKRWEECDPVSLFAAPLRKVCLSDYENIKSSLEREIKHCSILIIWTDCDREGENIGYEIIDVCKAVKPGISVYRAKFSEITGQSITRACNNLAQPDKKVSDAVDVRQQLDLRIGAAFTRFQTLRLQRVFPQDLAQALISYGSCQFPTLGFVVERYKQIQQFISEAFWKLKAIHNIDKDECVEFTWKRVRLFEKGPCEILLTICLENPTATVINVQTKPKTKWRPLPLDTVEMEKSASRKLRISAKETMKIAEKLYTQGYISYPRTETNIFPKEMDLRALVELQAVDQNWGEFAARILEHGPNPRAGKKTDQAHPPIHPTKHTSTLHGNEKTLYEFIVRSFLACCDRDAEGSETVVDVDIANEKFVAQGLIIIARNYLDVYPYDKWTGKVLPDYETGQVFYNFQVEMKEGATTAPPLLTEADLIALMEKHGIGTDATHAEHIETVKQRGYVGIEETSGKYFVPGILGMGLVEGYDSMGFAMSKPNLRAELEADLKRICDGQKDPQVVLREQVERYRDVFVNSVAQATKLDEALAEHFGQQNRVVDVALPAANPTMHPIATCGACGCEFVLKKMRDDSRFMISCSGFPDCKSGIWFPGYVTNVEALGDVCDECNPPVKLLKFTFSQESLNGRMNPEGIVACVGGCNSDILDELKVRSLRSFRRIDNVPTRNPPPRTAAAPVTSRPTQRPVASVRPQPAARMPRHGPQAADPSNAVQCKCGSDASLLTVKKNGPNHGRPFYSCSKPYNER